MGIKTKSERGPAGTLTADDLTRAIKNSIDRTGMKEEEARAMAQHVLNFFGYSERITDNALEAEARGAARGARLSPGGAGEERGAGERGALPPPGPEAGAEPVEGAAVEPVLVA